MILADSSVWIDHLRVGDGTLASLLERGLVLTHPFVVGEIALGSLRQRDVILGAMDDLPKAIRADDSEVKAFVERHRLWGRGIGHVDAHLLAAVRLTPDASLWTRDRRLDAVAGELELRAEP